MKDQFLLREDITFLNFGSFGACPKPIFENYQYWQRVLEMEPVQFITVDGYNYLKTSRKALAKYINCHEKNLVFVTNPTFAINILAKSLKLNPGDEILSTNIEYGAMDRTWEYYCEKSGANYIKQTITLPLVDKQTFIREFFEGFTSKTKVVFISQITSSTALILPVKEICEEAKRRGVITIVDGAHVPGHIELDLHELEADFYTGACHKWMMAPKGCSFLFAKEDFHSMLDPLIISWGYKAFAPSDSLFFDYHQFNGTRDFSAFLTIPACIDFMDKYDWKIVSESCKELLIAEAPRFFELLGSKPLAPLSKEFFGQICSIPISTAEPEKLQRLLFEKYKIEIPVMRHGNDNYIRFSIQVFNSIKDLNILFEALRDIMNSTDLIHKNS
jgi:isopenicillin-N epimerase